MVALLLVGAAFAQPRSGLAASAKASANVQRARQHFLAGKHAFESEAFARALREFQAGYSLEPRPGFLLNMGHAARRLGQLREARDYYQRFLATRPAPAASEQRAASQLIAEIERELPAEPPGRATVPPAATAGPGPAALAPAPAAASSPEVAAVAPRSPPEEAPPASPPAAAAAPIVEGAAGPKLGGARPTIFPGTLRAAPAAPGPEAVPDVPSGAGGLLTATTASTPVPAAADGTPVYRRWWFWAGAGVLAAGVLTAIVIGAQGAGTPARDNGSWGQIKL